jgi:hypothetical protein
MTGFGLEDAGHISWPIRATGIMAMVPARLGLSQIAPAEVEITGCCSIARLITGIRLLCH